MITDIIVSELAIYPVKSMGQIKLDSSRVVKFGLEHDRRWMLVDSNGKFITQRQQPRLCLVKQILSSDGICLTAPGMKDFAVTIPDDYKKLQVTVWNDQCSAIDSGEEAADWVSQFLGINSRLVYFPDNEIRQVDPDYAQSGDITAFSDGFPVLLISQASLDDLNSRLKQPVSMNRFRPNLVVSGCAAYAEDEWKRIKIGEIEYRVVKPCSRCIIPTIDLNTAKPGGEPLKTLATYRKNGNKVFFGQNVIANGSGIITTGMCVEILE
ncbi:MAG: MOSC domain-containing protein [Gammaproteobacteria bacterium]|nr:MOSC domain-containing protein [Gammaproteobacteria bacterium]